LSEGAGGQGSGGESPLHLCTEKGAEEQESKEKFAVRDLQEVLEARTDDRRIVAELLSVPVESMEQRLK